MQEALDSSRGFTAQPAAAVVGGHQSVRLPHRTASWGKGHVAETTTGVRRRVVSRVNSTASQGAGSRAKVFVRRFTRASLRFWERISSMRDNRSGKQDSCSLSPGCIPRAYQGCSGPLNHDKRGFSHGRCPCRCRCPRRCGSRCPYLTPPPCIGVNVIAIATLVSANVVPRRLLDPQSTSGPAPCQASQTPSIPNLTNGC